MIDITKLFSNLTVKSYPTFTYNGLVLTDTSLKAFELSVKGNNDNNNKIRESIIGAIINDKVPEEYYSLEEWASLKREIFIYLGALTPQPHSGKVECVHMGGRKFNFDFSIKIDDIYIYNTAGEGIFGHFRVHLKKLPPHRIRIYHRIVAGRKRLLYSELLWHSAFIKIM